MLLEHTPEAISAAQGASAIVFGSLAQRREPSRSTIRSLLQGEALRVFDVNLRPPHDDREVVGTSLDLSDIVKLNDDEMDRLVEWLGLPLTLPNACAELARRFSLQAVCVTRGERGAMLWADGSWFEHPGYAVTVADTVGSGDAFLAALLAHMQRGTPHAEALARANAAGAFVASKPGAVPNMDMTAIRNLASSR
ncbi:MAG: hypothetical protein FJX72_12715 [Armatimonadetes bacterium]|nr:hypothetical protein [Armatimonadota bacterium]